MIRVDCLQGSPEWLAVRIGLPTGSRFSKIITPSGAKSSSWEKLARALLAEQALGTPMEGESTGYMTRGSVLEHKARTWYEMEHDVDVEQVGFLMRDDRRCGCSPDGLVGTKGMIEIKSPRADTHIGYLLDGGIEYRAQVQGGLWIAEREWTDTMAFHPTLPDASVHTPRDDAYITKLERAVHQFCEYLDEQKRILIKKGVLPEQEFPALKIA